MKNALYIVAIFVMASLSSCVTAPQGEMQPPQQEVFLPSQQVNTDGSVIVGGAPNQHLPHHQQQQGQAMPDGRRLLGYATRTHTVTMDDGTVHHFNDEQLREFQRTHGAPRESTVNVDNSKPWFMDHSTGMIYAPGDVQGQGPPQMIPQQGRTVGSLYQPPPNARR